MNILFLYGATLAERWGRSQNLSWALADRGHEVEYLDCIRPAFRPSAPPKDLPSNLRWYPSAPGLPERRWSSGVHALWQVARLALLPRGFRDLLVFYGVAHPLVQAFALKRFPHQRAIYDCADDKVATFRDLAGPAVAARVDRWERALAARMDVLTAINETNLRRLDPTGIRPSAVVPNGVDTKLFRFRSRQIPTKFPLRIAYAGCVNGRLDVARMRRILEANPDCEIHVFGGDHPALDPVRGHPRLVLHGWIPYEDLPRHLDECDVGLVPYLDLPSIRASSPLKSLQYLAMGLPVLAFEYPGIPTFGGAVRILQGDRLPRDVRALSVGDDSVAKAHSWQVSANTLVQAAFR